MRSFQEKRRFKRLAYSKPSIVVLIIITIIVGRSVFSLISKNFKSASARNTAVRELRELEERKTAREADLARLSTERGLEEEFRTKYNLAKPGESALIIIEEEAE